MSLGQIWFKIYQLSKKENIEVYVVGGYVRDHLLGKKKSIKDIDLVVVGSGLEFARKFDQVMRKKGSLVEFPDFDTARYVFVRELKDGQKIKELEIEFAGAREEKYDASSRKPHVKATSLESDLSRRDFTVNAMARKIGALGPGRKVIDVFSGEHDLKAGILRTPLDPDQTFSEDPLRLMRAARFSAQLGFKIEEDTLRAIEINKERLKIISAERVQEELFKLLASTKPSIGLLVLYKTGLLNIVLPEVSALYGVEEIEGQDHKDNFIHTLKVVDNVAAKSDNVILRYSALLHDIGKPGTKRFVQGRGWAFDMHEHLGRKMSRDIGKRLRMSNDDISYVAKLIRWHQQPINLMDEEVTDSAIRRLIVSLGDNLDDLLVLCRCDITTSNPVKLKKRLCNYDRLEKRIREVREIDKLRAFQSPIRGEEIMQLCGLKPGPTVGKIKEAIEEAILDGKIPNDYDAAKKYFEKIKEGYLDGVKDWEQN